MLKIHCRECGQVIPNANPDDYEILYYVSAMTLSHTVWDEELGRSVDRAEPVMVREVVAQYFPTSGQAQDYIAGALCGVPAFDDLKYRPDLTDREPMIHQHARKLSMVERSLLKKGGA